MMGLRNAWLPFLPHGLTMRKRKGRMTHEDHAGPDRHPEDGGEERNFGRVPGTVMRVGKVQLGRLATEVASKEESLCAHVTLP